MKADPDYKCETPVETQYPYLFKLGRLRSAIPRFTRPEMVTYIPPSGEKEAVNDLEMRVSLNKEDFLMRHVKNEQGTRNFVPYFINKSKRNSMEIGTLGRPTACIYRL